MDWENEFLMVVLVKYIILKKIKISVQRPLKSTRISFNGNLVAFKIKGSDWVWNDWQNLVTARQSSIESEVTYKRNEYST